MAVTFTPDQQKVIDLHDRNILVSAAAGSGKTAVLVERIIQMISNEKKKVDIDRLLVVTFTNAAAAEMRERISQAIAKKLENEPENEHLQRQVALLHNAQITTIDSFCLFLIRNNFNDIGLDPGFRVADEGELKLLKQDLITDLLEAKYQEKNDDFLSCVEYFTGGSNDKLLEEYIIKLYEFSMSYPWPEEWLNERKNDYKIADVTEVENTDWCKYIIAYVKTTLKACVDKLGIAETISRQPAGPYYYGDLLEKEQEMLQKVADKESFHEIYEAVETINFARLPGKKDESVDEELRKKAQQLRNEVKKQIEEVKTSYFLLSPEQIVNRMQMAHPAVEMLVNLVLQFKQMFDAKKREENIIDFHDMEHFALEILLDKKEDGSYEATSAAKEYRQFFHEILIDEYQDSNLVQELLLKSVSGEDEGCFNRFMVGDVKQSIYKFRLARPELFIEKYTRYSKIDSDRQRIDLHKNFRSRPEVLSSVNDLFYKIMDTSLGGVAYDDDAALYPGAVFPEYDKNQTEVLLIGKDTESRLSAREQEALVLAGKIKELLRDFQVTDKVTGELRPVRYKDIVILLRTTSGWAEDFKKMFEKEGIPASVALQTGYFKAAEVRELLQLLRVLDNPLQDIPLFGVLKSFFGGFSEEEIAQIQGSGSKKALLYDNLKTFVNNTEENREPGEPETENTITKKLEKKVKDFLVGIDTLRKKATYTPIHRLLQEIMTSTGYMEYVSAKPGGVQRRANVEMLLTKAAVFEQTSYYGLFHFLRYMEQLEKYQVDYGEADILDENADVVRIMSIHKSKGLEFPVCFVAGLAKRFNMQDTTGRLIADVDMGIGVDFVDSERRVMGKTLRKNAVAMKLKLDSLGEELRVLYVVLTRAREKLFLSAMVSDADKWKNDLEQEILLRRQLKQEDAKIPFSTLAGATSYLDFIFPCLSEVKWVYPGDTMLSGVEEALFVTDLKQSLLLSQGDNNIMTRMSEKMKRVYPYQYLENLYVKTTVSELKKSGKGHLSKQSITKLDEVEGSSSTGGSAFTKELYEEPEIVPYIPSFVKQDTQMSGTDRGSIYHKVMELLDFESFMGKTDKKEISEELNNQLDGLVQNEKITQEQKEAVSFAKLLCFFKSLLAERMCNAAKNGKLYKEQPFVLGIEANRLDINFPKEEMVLIQGIIDVYFEEEDGIVVADYKTDRVNLPEELISRYQVQLDYYAEALERLTGKNVKEKIIYSFALGKEIKL